MSQHWENVYRKIIGIYRNFDAKLLISFFATVWEVFWEVNLSELNRKPLLDNFIGSNKFIGIYRNHSDTFR